MPVNPFLFWLAAFALGLALGILVAVFIPGWSLPYKLARTKPLVDDMLAADSHLDNQPSLEQQRRYEENSRLYRQAMQGSRAHLDELGVRAGRVTVNTRPYLFPWEEKGAREHAWRLYDQAVAWIVTQPDTTRDSDNGAT